MESQQHVFVYEMIKGETIQFGALSCGNRSVIMAEAIAAREENQRTKELGLKNIFIGGDNLGVIQAIEGCWKIPSEIDNMIKDAILDLHTFSKWASVHYFREANSIVDYLANFDHSCSALHLWNSSFDLSISHLIIGLFGVIEW